MKTKRLVTERLLLREVQKNDVDAIYHCWMQDEEVSRYMCWKASDDIEDVREFVEYELDNLENPNWNRWIIEYKATGEIMGTCLVFYNEEENSWDISYNLGRKYWGHGYITEAMQKAIEYSTHELGVREMIAVHAVENVASGRVIEKLGFQFVKTVPYECNGGSIHTEGKYYQYVVE